MQNAEEQLLSLIERLRHFREKGANAGKTAPDGKP
jgi:hypothetical protein